MQCYMPRVDIFVKVTFRRKYHARCGEELIQAICTALDAQSQEIDEIISSTWEHLFSA